jgi:hypothetical protein
MNAAQILKLALALAIVLTLYRLVTAQNKRPLQPYEPYEDAAGEDAEDDDSDAEDDDSDAEDDDSDAEDDDSDAEDDDSDAEDDDSDAEDDIEGFANSTKPFNGKNQDWGAPVMNLATGLLPKPVPKGNQDWSEFAPKSLLRQNFLSAEKYVGINTVGNSLRNANRDLRSAPAIPRGDVGPWAQSTIDSDLYRKPLE